MKKYDGWVLKSGKYLHIGFLHYTRREVIDHVEKVIPETWKNHRKKGTHKIVKVKLVEVEDG